MAFDAGFLYTICDEIRGELCDSRLERIFQCTRDTFVLEFRAAKKPRKLFISAGPSGGFCYLTDRKIRHPDVPPMFCMLLRKHLSGGRFLDARQVGFERVMCLEIEFFDAFGAPLIRHLYLEAMGKNSNLILCDERDTILGALRTLDLAQNPDRPLLCGMNYQPPCAREGARSLLDPEIGSHIRSAFDAAAPEGRAQDVLLGSVMGIGPGIARELIFSASGDVAALSSSVNIDLLSDAVAELKRRLSQREFDFCAVYDSAGDARRVCEYSYIPLCQYGAFATEHFNSPSELMEAVMGAKAERERLRRHTDRASAVLKAAQKRLRRKSEALLSDLEEAKRGEEKRLFGDLIMQEIWRVNRGDSVLHATDYTSGGEVVIPLDARLSPSQNAQRYYKQYQKQKRALTSVADQLRQTQEELAYAESIEEALSRVETVEDAEQICSEVVAWDYGRRFARRESAPKQKAKKSATVQPSACVSPGGFAVWFGRNNLQNEELTFRMAAKNDLWFHAKGVPGPHVILRVEGNRPVTEADLVFCARLALPRRRAAVGCEIDYTAAKYVKHHPSHLPGRVVYTGEKSFFVRNDG